MNYLRRLTSGPRFDMSLGILLLLVSGDEVFEALSNGLHHEDLNSDLGITLFGIANIIKALPDLFEGLEHISRTRD